MADEKLPILYRENVDIYLDRVLFDEFYLTMPAERREKIDRLSFEKDKRLSLGAGVLLSKALSDFSRLSQVPCVPETGWKIHNGPFGKPYLSGFEGFFQFNLSHSGNQVFCAVNHGPGEVGCDVEKIRDGGLKVAERYFHPDELRLLSDKSPAERTECFYRLWTLKESYLKALGTGLSQPLNEFRICFSGDSVSVFPEIGSKHFRFGSFLDDGYAYAWCLEVTNE